MPPGQADICYTLDDAVAKLLHQHDASQCQEPTYTPRIVVSKLSPSCLCCRLVPQSVPHSQASAPHPFLFTFSVTEFFPGRRLFIRPLDL
jgi:hypothetical protein